AAGPVVGGDQPEAQGGEVSVTALAGDLGGQELGRPAPVARSVALEEMEEPPGPALARGRQALEDRTVQGIRLLETVVPKRHLGGHEAPGPGLLDDLADLGLLAAGAGTADQRDAGRLTRGEILQRLGEPGLLLGRAGGGGGLVGA